MPEKLEYSAVAAVNTLQIATQAAGIGAGWVSILDPKVVCEALKAPPNWRLIAYLCIGHTKVDSRETELLCAEWRGVGI